MQISTRSTECSSLRPIVDGPAAGIAATPSIVARRAGNPPIRRRRGQSLYASGTNRRSAYVIVSGWSASCRVAKDGSRAFTGLHFPGDLAGVADLLQGRSSGDVVALCDVVVRPFDGSDLDHLFDDPASARALAVGLAGEVHAERALLAACIAADARGRIVALALEIVGRLGPVTGGPVAIATPLRQADIAEFTGMTAVHANRTIRSLREEGIVAWSRDTLTVADPVALRAYPPTRP